MDKVKVVGHVEKDEALLELPVFNEIERNYLEQLKLGDGWRVFFYSTEIEWLDWDELKESLEAEDYISIQISELDSEFTRIRCPEGYLLVGAENTESKKKVYNFVKAFKTPG